MTNATPARRCCVALRRCFSAIWTYEKLRPNEPDANYLRFLLNRADRYWKLAEAIATNELNERCGTDAAGNYVDLQFHKRAERIKREVYNRRGRLASQS